MTYQAVEHSDQSQLLLPSRDYPEHWKPAPAAFVAITTSSSAGDTCDVTEQQPERLRCAAVESNFLQTLGVRVTLGRGFTPEDDVRGAPPVAIISHGVWTRRFGADPGAIGRSLDVNGKRTRVIGVLPAGFAMPGGQADILRPQQLYPLVPSDGSLLAAFGRLKPGITPAQAEAAIAPIIAATARGSGGVRPAGPRGQTFHARVVPLRDYLVGEESA
jgi:hypothetical protein